MAGGVNELSAQGIEKAINGLIQMLIMTITGVEEIVVFIINLLTQTYICLITFVIGGSLHAAIAVAEDVGSFLNSTAKDVGNELGDVASDFEKAMNGFVSDVTDLIGKAESIFSDNDTPDPPKLDLTSQIDKLKSLKLPTDYDKDLQTLDNNIPTFEEVNNFTQTAIKWPFEQVKQLFKRESGQVHHGSVFISGTSEGNPYVLL